MGLENCDKNAWAVALKEVVIAKCQEEVLNLNEEQRNKVMSKNNETMVKGIKAL